MHGRQVSHPTNISHLWTSNFKRKHTLWTEINFALKSSNGPQKLSVRRATSLYNVDWKTLRSRRDTQPNKSKLSIGEEAALDQYMMKLYAQGFASTLGFVAEIVN